MLTREEIAEGKRLYTDWRKNTNEKSVVAYTKLRAWLMNHADSLLAAAERCEQLEVAIIEHRNQRADDRCWMDDRALYAAIGDGDLGDNTTCNPEEMLANCKRFIECRMQGGEWQSYQSLQAEVERLRAENEKMNANQQSFSSMLAEANQKHIRSKQTGRVRDGEEGEK